MTWNECSTALLKAEENWGIVELGYEPPAEKKKNGKIKLLGFRDFCPYIVDLDEYRAARESFELPEWIDIVLGQSIIMLPDMKVSAKSFL